MSTIFEALRTDHDRQRDLIDRLVDTTGASDDRVATFDALRDEMTAHADMEERWFYRQLMTADMSQDKARHGVAEHKELDDFLEQLEGYEMSGPQWIQTAEQLRHRLLHHLEEEEREVFQIAGKVLTEESKTKLAQEYRTGMAERRQE